MSSVPGEGTTFRVYLPLAEGAATSAVDRPSLTERPLAAQKGVLLIVDDDVRVRRLLSRFSTRAGYEVLSAENGLEAVEIYKQHEERISGVVLDLNMPVCDGEECYARLRALDPAVKVIVSSGNLVTKTTLPQLPKPYSLQTFVSAVNELLR